MVNVVRVFLPKVGRYRALAWMALAFVAAVSRATAQGGWCPTPIKPCDPNDPTSTSCYVPPRPNPKCEPKVCDKCTHSPCYVGTGSYTTSELDLNIHGVGAFTLEASRHYDSTKVLDGPVGVGWSSSVTPRIYYTLYLFAAPSTYQKEADLIMPDGSFYRFVDTGSGFNPPAGRKDVLTHNGDGSFDLVLQRSSSVLHFDPTGALASVADDFGNSLQYSYTAGRLQQVADMAGSGRYLNISWGPDGRISTIQDSSGRSVQYTYTSQGALNTVTDAAGRASTYSYAAGRFGPILNQIKDPWNRIVTAVTYDSRDRVVTSSVDGEIYTYGYNYNSTATTSKRDSLGNSWLYPFASGGMVTDTVPPSGGGGTTHTDYYPDGTVQQFIDGTGVRTYYTYLADGRALTTTRDYQGPSAVLFEYSYDSAFPFRTTALVAKNPTTNAVDPTWRSWRYDYFQAGDLCPGGLHHVYRVREDGITLDTVKTYTCDSHGRVTQQSGPGSAVADFTYDSQGNLATVRGPAFDAAGTRPLTTYGYDALGRPTSVTDANGNVESYTYDSLGRTTSMTLPRPSPSSPLSFTVSYSFDHFDAASGLLFVVITDPNGAVSQQGYDQFGRIGKSIDNLGHATTYAYAHGLLMSVSDANNNVTNYSYDAGHRLVAVTYPDGSAEHYTYTGDNRLYQRTDRKGQTASYSYDHLKRLAMTTLPGGGTVTRSYNGQSLSEVVDTSVSPSETHLYGYDAAYRLTSETQGSRGTVSRVYNDDDTLASLSVQGGSSVTYSYFANGRVSTLSWSAGVGNVQYQYRPTGEYASVTYPNGQTRSFAYDNQGRLTQVANQVAGGGTIAAYAYGYDFNYTTGQSTKLGQRTSTTATVPSIGWTNVSATYEYDSLYQLVKVSYPPAAPFSGEVDAWSYDAIGNRATATSGGSTATYQYQKVGSNPNNWQRLTSDGTNAYTYDANGSQLTRSGPGGTFNYTWGLMNRLASVGGAATASYAYDYQGRRTSTTTGGATTTYLFDGANVVRESSGSAAEYLFGPGTDEPLAMSRGGQVYYFVTDGQGSVTALTNSAGTVQDWYVYDVWGQARSQSAPVAQPMTYTGRESAVDGSLFYRARFYSPSIGRFLSQDPASDASAISAYAYGQNAPTEHLDPMGLFSVSDQIVRQKSINIFAQCGDQSAGACTKGYYVLLDCKCDGCDDSWHAQVTLVLRGTLYYYPGPFARLHRKPTDPSVVDPNSEIAHEYNYHINKAVAAIAPLLEGYESTSYGNQEVCMAMCPVVHAQAQEIFARVMGVSQADENGQPYKP